MFYIGVISFFGRLEEYDVDTRMRMALVLQNFSQWLVSDEAKGQVFQVYVEDIGTVEEKKEIEE